jgi:hypothetical protein
VGKGAGVEDRRGIIGVMIGLGLGLLFSIFASFGCLIAGFNSLISLRNSYNGESRLTAIMGFIGGIAASAFFGWLTIWLLNRLDAMNNVLFN